MSEARSKGKSKTQTKSVKDSQEFTNGFPCVVFSSSFEITQSHFVFFCLTKHNSVNYFAGVVREKKCTLSSFVNSLLPLKGEIAWATGHIWSWCQTLNTPGLWELLSLFRGSQFE